MFDSIFVDIERDMKNMVKKDQTASRAKRVGKFILTTIIYCAILIALIYLYRYSGLTSVHFIYNEF